jgi:hypothetical protein
MIISTRIHFQNLYYSQHIFAGGVHSGIYGNWGPCYANVCIIKDRIEAHICIAFTAYCVYKELERILYQEKSTLSLKKAAELTHNMYQITYTLPDSKHTKSKLLKMDEKQQELYEIIQNNF